MHEALELLGRLLGLDFGRPDPQGGRREVLARQGEPVWNLTTLEYD